MPRLPRPARNVRWVTSALRFIYLVLLACELAACPLRTSTRGQQLSDASQSRKGNGADRMDAGTPLHELDAGQLRAIWAVNHEPEIDDVTFTDSSFVCGPTLKLCATAHDVDGDSVMLELEATKPCTIAKAPANELEASDSQSRQQCWKLSCHVVGKVPLHVYAYDLLEVEDEVVRVEDILADIGGSSHSELEFAARFEGTLVWQDSDGDGQGDSATPPKVSCDPTSGLGWSLNGDDCDDKSEDTYQGANEICHDLADNNCNGLVDEKCIFVPRSLL